MGWWNIKTITLLNILRTLKLNLFPWRITIVLSLVVIAMLCLQISAFPHKINVSNDGLWWEEAHKVKSKWKVVNWTLDSMIRNITIIICMNQHLLAVFCSAFHQWRSTAAKSSAPQQNKSYFT